MTERLDCVVVGGGVVGLAVGKYLAEAGRNVVVLEAEPEIGMHTSSRNSEVIHAGIYYDQDSLKAKLCVQGREMLYDYCEARRIPHKRIGKLIVASHESELDRLDAIREKAQKNGVTNLQRIGKAEIREREPAIAAEAALFSPSTGIIDSHTLMLSLQADIEACGGAVLTHSKVANARVSNGGFELSLDDSDETFRCRMLVNSAGLHAGQFANRIAGLGVHATNDMGNCARFGPDVEWIADVDYAFDDSRKSDFAKAIRRFLPDLDENRLAPAYTGIRPKLAGPGEPARDFIIQDEAVHGIPELVNLFGIESPGLTACLAIGDLVAHGASA